MMREGGAGTKRVRISKKIDKISSIFADPIVKASIVLSASLEARRRFSECNLDNIVEAIPESVSSNKVIFVVLEGSREKFSAELLIYKDVLVAAHFVEGGKSIQGSEALRSLSRVKGDCDVILYSVAIESIDNQELKTEVIAAVEEERKKPPHAWVGSILYGMYKVTSILSEGKEGAFSYILEALDPLGVRVALKVLKGEEGGVPSEREVSKFIGEHAAQARLASVDRGTLIRMLNAQDYRDVDADSILKYRSNIVKVYAVIAPKGWYDGLEDYIKAPPLASLELMEGDITKLKEGDLKRNLVIIIQSVGGALAVAHAMGIGHFDVKPNNVLFKRRGGELVFKISDFVGYNVTMRGITVDRFTIEYVDPLLLANKGLNVSLDSDVFNFASFTLRLLLGRNSECLAIVNTALMSLITRRIRVIDVLSRSYYARDLARTINKMLSSNPSFTTFIANVVSEYEKCILKEIEEATSTSPIDISGFLSKALSLERALRPKNMIEAMMELGLL